MICYMTMIIFCNFFFCVSRKNYCLLFTVPIITNFVTAIISRQFVEMNRSRIEGLLAAFPKLMNTGKQHTFVETESVRYVYQPLEKLYMLLITTKASNILEDLETLRLFARVVSIKFDIMYNVILQVYSIFYCKNCLLLF